MIYPSKFLFKQPTPRTAMAQSFNGSTQFSSSSQTLTLQPYVRISVGFWLNWTTFSNNDALALEYSVNFNTNSGTFLFDPNSSSPHAGSFDVGVGGGNGPHSLLAGFTRPAAGVWNHILALFNIGVTGANQIPNIFVNGLPQSLSYTDTASVTNNFGIQKIFVMSRAGASLFAAGAMSDLVIYRDLLSQSDALALANGADPRTLRGDDLLYYWTLSVLHPEPNWGWNSNMMAQSTTTAVSGPQQLVAQAKSNLLSPELVGKAGAAAGGLVPASSMLTGVGR